MNINFLHRQQSAQQPASNNEMNTMPNTNTTTVEEYITKEQAQSAYLAQNASRIRQKGFTDAGHSAGDPIALECGLCEVRNDYLSWCHQHRSLFTANMREAVANVKQLLNQRQSELRVKEGELDHINQQLADSQKKLTCLSHRHYKTVEALKMLFSVACVVLGMAWVGYVYSNFFADLTCLPRELKENGIFSEEGFRQGLKFAAVPITLSLFIGLSSRRYWPVKLILGLAFVAMDVTFSYNVELRLTQIQQAMGIDQQFDIAHFLMVTFMAFLPVCCLTSTIAWAKDMIYLDGVAEASADNEKIQSAIDLINAKKSELQAIIERLKAEIKDKTESILDMEGSNEQLTTWYTGRMIKHLFNLYYTGFLRYVNSMTEPDEASTSQSLKAEYKRIFETFLKAA